MRPVLMASLRAQPALTFNPVPGDYENNGGALVAFVIDASQPVQWFWSATGAVPSSSVANGATADRITFTLTNSTFVAKSCTILVSSGDNSWTINLTAEGRF